jgi:hypothetical protein
MPAPLPGTRHCSSDVAPTSGENAVHIPSADSGASAASGSALPPAPVLDPRQGPRECGSRKLMPRRGLSFLSGAQQVRFSANSRLYCKSDGRRPPYFSLAFSRIATAVCHTFTQWSSRSHCGFLKRRPTLNAFAAPVQNSCHLLLPCADIHAAIHPWRRGPHGPAILVP